MEFFQLVINSIIIGSIYALVAAGFSLIYTTNKYIHFAHGISISLSAYLLFAFFSLLEIPFIISSVLTIILTALFGTAMFLFIYSPLKKNKASNVILLIASLAMLMLFQNIFHLIFGSQVKSLSYIKIQTGLNILGAKITMLQIIIILVSAIFFILLMIFMKYAKLGKEMRAVADNNELASIIGINPKITAIYSFIIGSAMAAIGGILIALEQNISPTMGTELMIKGFTGAIIGGIGSVAAAIPGSYILGFIENFGVWLLPSGYKPAIAFSILFIFLLFKPSGLFGTKKGVKHD